MRVTFFPKRVIAASLSGFMVALICVCLLNSQQDVKPDTREPESAVALINQAAVNELAALQTTDSVRYHRTLEWKSSTETRDVIETPQGRAERIIRFNDRPLAPDQEDKQEQRLKKLIRDPSAARHEIEEQKSELKRRIALMKAFPAAFIFTPDGEEDGKLKFSFRPTGSFQPPDRETQIYRALEGTVWVEPRQKRLTRIDGIVTRNVPFGWGIFGKLYKGGRYLIEQKEVQPETWQVTRLDLDLKVRIFLGTSHLVRKEQNTGFEAVPAGLTYKQALELLLDSSRGPETDGHR
jgi:hypothetical protein